MRAIVSTCLLLCAASPASAEWWEAETDHFIVYSDTDEDEAQALALRLERIDEAMRFLQGMGAEESKLPRAVKLTLYNFGSVNDIHRLYSDRPNGVAGFFMPRAGHSVAFTPVDDESRSERNSSMFRSSSSEPQFSDSVLPHEYAHYFMYQHAAAAYPKWYSEGFAEVYGALVLHDDGFRIGEPASHRGTVLRRYGGYHVRRLLDPPPFEDWQAKDAMQVYALGYLLAHYLTFSGERPGQLGEYLRLLNTDSTPLEAAEGAFGDLDELDRELDSYRRRSRLPVRDVSFSDYAPPSVTARRLPEAEAAQMSLQIALQRGAKEDKAQGLVPDARSLAQRFPNSARVHLSLAQAEFAAGNLDEAEAAAQRVLAIQPQQPAAHIALAKVAMKRAEADPAQYLAARREFTAANALEADNPEVLYGYYRSFAEAGEAVPDTAFDALDYAQVLAAFDDEIRFELARVKLQAGDREFALDLLAPLVNDPHPSEFTNLLKEAVHLLEDGDFEGGMEQLARSAEQREKEQDGEDD